MDTGPAALAIPVFDLGIAVAEAHELRLRRNCLLPSRARASVRLCRWDDAIADLSTVLHDPGVADMNRCIVLAQLGTMRARRGDPGAVAALEEALTLASALHEAQLIQPVRIGLAEAAWLADDLVRAASEIEAALPLVPLLDHGFLRELAFWAHRTGVDWIPDDRSMELVPEILADDFHAQAAFWEGRGGLYEAADALGESDVEDDLRDAHPRLGGDRHSPTCATGRRVELREPRRRETCHRGPRPSNSANARGHSPRELEVAALLASGLTNGEVADRGSSCHRRRSIITCRRSCRSWACAAAGTWPPPRRPWGSSSPRSSPEVRRAGAAPTTSSSRLLADVAEPHDGLGLVAAAVDVDDDAFAELLVAHVVADAQPELLGAARARRRRSCAALVAAARCRRIAAATTDVAVPAEPLAARFSSSPIAIDQLGRDLVEEAARRPVVGRAEHHAAPRVAQVEPLLGARDADVTEAAFLFELVGIAEAAHVREHAVFEPMRNTTGILETLRRVQRHQRDRALPRDRSRRGR